MICPLAARVPSVFALGYSWFSTATEAGSKRFEG
jgi:hypothetical protein